MERFIVKTGLQNVLRIVSGDEIVDVPYILLTYTAPFGKVPVEVEKFLARNSALMVGVAGSGNKNWGDSFCNAVNLIKLQYNVKEILKFELAGNTYDVNDFLERVGNEAFRIK